MEEHGCSKEASPGRYLWFRTPPWTACRALLTESKASQSPKVVETRHNSHLRSKAPIQFGAMRGATGVDGRLVLAKRLEGRIIDYGMGGSQVVRRSGCRAFEDCLYKEGQILLYIICVYFMSY
jgi:hypothetical protein